MTSSPVDSLRMVLWSQSFGFNEEFMAALGWRHFSRGQKIADHSVLADAAAEAGLDREDAMKVLKSERYTQELFAGMMNWKKDIEVDNMSGMTAIPCFLFRTTNPKWSHKDPERLQGSTPQPMFEQVLRNLEAYEGWLPEAE